MKRLLICFCLFTITLLVSACGKTEFSSTDQASAAQQSADADDAKLPAEEVINGGGDDDELAEIHACGDKKVYVCHMPSGNTGNAHTICIARAALAAHLGQHGDAANVDTLGKCDSSTTKRCQNSGSQDDDT